MANVQREGRVSLNATCDFLAFTSLAYPLYRALEKKIVQSTDLVREWSVDIPILLPPAGTSASIDPLLDVEYLQNAMAVKEFLRRLDREIILGDSPDYGFGLCHRLSRAGRTHEVQGLQGLPAAVNWAMWNLVEWHVHTSSVVLLANFPISSDQWEEWHGRAPCGERSGLGARRVFHTTTGSVQLLEGYPVWLRGEKDDERWALLLNLDPQSLALLVGGDVEGEVVDPLLSGTATMRVSRRLYLHCDVRAHWLLQIK